MSSNMDKIEKIRHAAITNDEREFTSMLISGLNPNFEGGWPIRLAARHGSHSVVKQLLHYGANPHLLSDSGASTLQLAVFSGQHWETRAWSSLLSCCDSSQLADGAAVAVIFKNVPALKQILETKRCNTNIPTTLTGKTIEQLAKGYKLDDVLSITQNLTPSTAEMSNITTAESRIVIQQSTPVSSPRNIHTEYSQSPLSQPNTSRNLSPSVARFFQQTSNQVFLSPNIHRTQLNWNY